MEPTPLRGNATAGYRQDSYAFVRDHAFRRTSLCESDHDYEFVAWYFNRLASKHAANRCKRDDDSP
jgi:hypothetical protein